MDRQLDDLAYVLLSGSIREGLPPVQHGLYPGDELFLTRHIQHIPSGNYAEHD